MADIFKKRELKVDMEYKETVIAFFYAIMSLWQGILAYGIWSPLKEEVIFRGIIYRLFRKYLPIMAAVFGSALMFGFFHGNSVQMVYGTIMGIVMALLYEKYQTLIAPILFHGAANTAIYIVTYFF